MTRRKFADLPLGARFHYLERSDRFYVKLRQGDTGLIAVWKGPNQPAHTQEVFSFAESSELTNNLEVICIDAEPCEAHRHPGCPNCYPNKTVPELNQQYARAVTTGEWMTDQSRMIQRVYTREGRAVVVGIPTKDHNCDAMGCPTLEHVLARVDHVADELPGDPPPLVDAEEVNKRIAEMGTPIPDDSWEANVESLLANCSHTIRVRPGFGEEDLIGSLCTTFLAMKYKLDALPDQRIVIDTLKSITGWADTLAEKIGWTRDNAASFWASRDFARKVAATLETLTPKGPRRPTLMEQSAGISQQVEISSRAKKAMPGLTSILKETRGDGHAIVLCFPEEADALAAQKSIAFQLPLRRPSDILGAHLDAQPVVVQDEPNAHVLKLKVGVQIIQIGSEYFEDREHAEWMGKMLLHAIDNALGFVATPPEQLLTREQFDTELKALGERLAEQGKPVVKTLLADAEVNGRARCLFDNWPAHLKNEAYQKLGVRPVERFIRVSEGIHNGR